MVSVRPQSTAIREKLHATDLLEEFQWCVQDILSDYRTADGSERERDIFALDRVPTQRAEVSHA